MISVSGLEKSYGERTLFGGVSLQLNPGERYGLVGANGSGKTTLLNVLSGVEDATAGSVSIPKRVKLGVLRQDQFVHEDRRILEVALMGNPALWEALEAKEALLAASDGDFDVHRFSELEEIILHHDGYAAEARAAVILEGLGIPTDVQRRPLSTLSGGFKLRVLLAQALAGSPDALLLDEPTNHLDILSIRWLEKFLREFAGPVVVISHDHRFLDNVVTHILDVDYETVTLYHGTYSDFLDQKAAERERREKEIELREREIAHHQQFVDRFRAKASKARQAQSRVRMIEKKAESLEALPQSSRRWPTFRFVPRRHSGKDVLALTRIRKAYGDNEVLHGVDLEVRRGDRVAILGPNGIGKSTLLKIAVGDLEPDAGSVKWGYEAHPGYFAQDHHEQFEDPDRTAIEWIWDSCSGASAGFVRGELGLVLFSGDEAEKRLGALSGGEAARLVFCRLAIQKPNVLVLDEPTNHLDLEAIEALVESLSDFDGTLLFVSHDRWFVSRLATRIVEIRPDGIRDYRGSYEDYVHACGDDHLDIDTVVLRARRERGASATGSAPDLEKAGNGAKRGKVEERREAPTPARRADQLRLRELDGRRDRVTERIARIETRVAEIDAVFADPSFYESAGPEAIRILEEERGALAAELEERLAEWERVEGEIEEASRPADA
ncbi:MAG: ABC-F family ATP-binding cassette domain-containing protein [Gemmatimonadota bacterium]